jgi:uncharacterized protein
VNEQQNLQTVREMYEAFGRGDVGTILSRVTEDTVWCLDGSPRIPWAGTYHGRDAVAGFFATYDRSVEIEQFEPLEYIAQGDKVVVLGHERVTVRTTGRPVQHLWAMAFTLRDGKVVRFQNYSDTERLRAAFEPV